MNHTEEGHPVAVARALATHPTIVIMDEPTGNRDRANSANVRRPIRDWRTATGTTCSSATHDLNGAAVNRAPSWPHARAVP